MRHEPHNGSWNYETFTVSLTIDNDEGLLDFWTDRAMETVKTEQGDYELGQELKDEFCGHDSFKHLPGWAGTLLQSALDEVNWREIAAGLIGTANEILDIANAPANV